MQACDAGSDCDLYFQCVAQCADPDCWAMCGAENSAGLDAYGAVNRSGGVAFTAHLGGALFAFLYYKWGGRLELLFPAGMSLPRLSPRPKLRVHDPGAYEEVSTDSRVDEILKKIQEHGQDSLTRAERQILEEASREYQKRRQ